MRVAPWWSLGGTLSLMRPYLGSTLVDARAWDTLADIANDIPATAADIVYLECRLASGQTRVDLILRLDGHHVERLRTVIPEADSLWLELDADRAEPSLFVGFDERQLGSPPNGWESIYAALVRVADHEPPLPVRETLRRAWRAFSAPTTIPYIGYLAARQPPVARLYVRGCEDSALLDGLMAAGWTGSRHTVASMLAPARATGVAPGLAHLDIAPDGSVPRIGIEFTLARRCQRRREIAEQPWLRWLEEAELCAPDKRAALGAFPGVSVETPPHDLRARRIDRRLNCIKLALDVDGRVEAKAYCRQQVLLP